MDRATDLMPTDQGEGLDADGKWWGPDDPTDNVLDPYQREGFFE